jgi:hypothetical protein
VLTDIENQLPLVGRQRLDPPQQRQSVRGPPRDQQVDFDCPSARGITRDESLDAIVANEPEQLIFFIETH